MTKQDFHKGQTVWVYLVGNAARYVKSENERIREFEVVSVGTKYITVRDKKIKHIDAKFDIQNNFRQVYDRGGVDYVLYLSKEDILKDLYKQEIIGYIDKTLVYRSCTLLNRMDVNDLEAIYDVVKKYE